MLFFLLIFFKFSFAQTSFEGLQTGRYEIKKVSTPKKLEKIKLPQNRRPSNDEGDQVDTETEKSVQLLPQSSPVESKSENLVDQTTQTEESSQQSVNKDVDIPKQEPTLSEQAQSLADGTAERVYNFYKEQVHTDDIRNNHVEIEFSPGVTVNSTKSNYSYREHSGTFPTVNLKSNIWFTPMIGVSGRYTFSIGGDITGDRTTNSKVSARFENLIAAISLRKFFGLSRKSNSLETQFLYNESKLNVPFDSTSRGRIKTTGFGIGLAARLPVSASYAWTLGGNFFPKMQHSETETALALHSGTSTEALKIGFDFGGEFKFDRGSQLIWQMGYSYEKNLFSGSASISDPLTGQTPSNVNVNNTSVFLNLGYRWGI